MSERRQAVVDLGSNSFRLVVFTWHDGGPATWWKRTDEVHEAVRLGEGMEADGRLHPEPVARALRAVALFAHYCRASGIADVRPVATSAVRDAANQAEFLAEVVAQSGFDVRVLPPADEARYGYLAAVNSTTLADGLALDIGGGSMQLTRVTGRAAADARSWPLGAVRMTERFLAGRWTAPKRVRALRDHVRAELAAAPWLDGLGDGGRRMVGVGGAVRNLADAAQRLRGAPVFTVQGVWIERAALGELIDRMLELPANERSRIPGIKAGRAEIILASAVVIDEVMEHAGFAALEATEAGLREGVFFESLLAGAVPPLLDDVRAASVRNLAAQFHPEFAHTEHVARLALQMWDALGAAGRHPADPDERELLWAAAMLHDIGMAVDYDDHHKHSRYLILNAGLAGFSARETALIAQMARFHRKGAPVLGELAPLARRGDDDLLARSAALLRLAEMLERAHDQSVQAVRLELADGAARLLLDSRDDATLARWSAERERGLFERAFGVALTLSD